MSAHVNTDPTRVLVVDDHELFRIGLRRLLEVEGFDVAEAVSAQAALRRLQCFAADVVVAGVNLLGPADIDTARDIRAAAPATAVLMLSTLADREHVLRAVRAGAAGYLLKASDLTEIVAAIRAVAAGHSALCPQAARALVDHVQAGGALEASAAASEPHDLSPRELQVLSLLASGCDNAEIGRTLFVSHSTVKNHVSRVLEKLEVDNRVQAATYAIRRGLVDRQLSSV
jgi:DNA-binding NarL/FixJ family response regulator